MSAMGRKLPLGWDNKIAGCQSRTFAANERHNQNCACIIRSNSGAFELRGLKSSTRDEANSTDQIVVTHQGRSR